MESRRRFNELDTRTKAFNAILKRSFARGKFVLASGRESNFYLDMKPMMFHPEGANLISELIFDRIKDLKVDYVGGLEMGAVPLVTAVSMLSHQKGLPVPAFFVRKKVKDHGTKKLIEAASDLKGKNVVILDDVTTSGGSALEAVNAVEQAGGKVLLVLAIVDREEGAEELYKAKAIPFDSLYRVREFLAATAPRKGETAS